MKKRKVWTEKEDIVSEVLKPLFQLGYSVNKACNIAGLAQRTVQSWIEKDDTLRLKITSWQNEVNHIARANLVKVIRSGKPEAYQASLFWLKTREREDFGDKPEEVRQPLSYSEIIALQNENEREAIEIEKSWIPKKGLYDRLKAEGKI